MGLGGVRIGWGGTRYHGAFGWMRRFLARVCAGCLLLVGIVSAAPAVAAAGTSTAQPSPVATQPKLPPTTPPATGASGLLTPGTADPTSRSTSAVTPTPAPPATPAITAVPSSLQQPAAVTPTGAPPATATQVPPAATPRQPTATATHPASSPTATTGPMPTVPPTATPTGTPTVVPATPPPPPVPTMDLSGLRILDNPGIGGNAAIAHAALRHFGEYYRPDGAPWTGWCEMYVGNVMAEVGIARPRYESAILDAISGPLYRGQAPAGSLVFFDQRSSPYGHVGVSLGDGTMLSALGGGIVRTTYQDWVSYLGWRPYGTDAPAEEPLVIAPLLLPAASDDVPDLQMPPWPEQSDWYAPPPYIAPHTAMK